MSVEYIIFAVMLGVAVSLILYQNRELKKAEKEYAERVLTLTRDYDKVADEIVKEMTETIERKNTIIIEQERQIKECEKYISNRDQKTGRFTGKA